MLTWDFPDDEPTKSNVSKQQQWSNPSRLPVVLSDAQALFDEIHDRGRDVVEIGRWEDRCYSPRSHAI